MKFLKNYRSTVILLSAMLIGTLLGLYVPAAMTVLTPIGNAFMNLLYCLIVPLIFVSLVASLSRMKDSTKLKKIFVVMTVVFTVVSLLTAIYMAVGCMIYDPSKGVSLVSGSENIDLSKSSSNFLAAFTTNDFYLLFSRNNLLALVVFSIAFGMAVFQLQEKVPVISSFFDQLEMIITRITGYVMKLAPIGIGAIFAGLAQKYGGMIFSTMKRTTILYFIAFPVYFVIIDSLMAYISAGWDGVRAFWKYQTSPALTGLGTSSSAASLPSVMEACEQMGIPQDVSSLAVPIGTSLHKVGGTMTQILKIAVVGGMYGLSIASPSMFFKAIFIAFFIAAVAGAIPGGGYIGEIIIMSTFGFPQESLPIMILIATLYDATNTCLNCSEKVSVTMLITRFVYGKDWLRNAMAEKKDEQPAA